ncbi:MAG TPA: DUF4872 domain-containing protein [Solirubrobacteraceae bacterium]|nr:DUF4872 domain-containing protein [Solirubrobacteraceae bacterium]
MGANPTPQRARADWIPRAASPAAAAFRHRVAEHAASGALRDVLEHHRLSYAPEPLSEGAVFGFAGALDLRVRIAGAAIPAIDLDGRAPAIELHLCEHLGVPARWRSTGDPGAGREILQVELDAGRPTLVRADAAELDYRGAARHDTRHAVVVTSVDEQAGIAWVADGGFPEPQRCGLRSLAAARASHGWPEPARHGLLQILARPARLTEPPVAVAAAIDRVVTALRRPPRPHHPHVRAGLAAADALAEAWPALPAAAGARLGATLGALRARIRDGGTGGTLYRSLQARFLHDAAALLGSPHLGRAALVCDDLADAWRMLAAAIDADDAALAHRVGEPWLQRVRALEHQHVEALEEHLRIHRALAA